MVNRILKPDKDAACKKLFGTSANAGLTLALLNHALAGHLDRLIVSLTFPSPQQRPAAAAPKAANVLCVAPQRQHYP